MSIKISELPAGSALSGTEEIPIVQSATTKKITAQDVADLASGGDLQQVTDNGNTTTHDLIVTDGSGEGAIIGQSVIVTQNTDNDSFASINNDGSLSLQGNGVASQLKNTNVTNPSVILEFPDKATGSYTIATTNDLTSGYVPYTGATADVDLGTYHLDAAKGTFNHNGSTDTLTANHASGSGIGLLITKGGANEGLKVNKTSGSGNAATIIGTLEATTLVKTGGLATEFLMADGTTSAGGGGITVGTTPVTSGTDGRVFFQAGGVIQQDSAFFWDNTNKRLGIGTTPSTSRLNVLSTNNTDADMQIRIGSTDAATRFYTIGRESANGQLAFRWGGEAGALGAQFYFPVTTFNTITSSSSDQGTSRLRVGNTGVGGRTFALVAGVHNSSQSNFSLYDETAGVTRFIIDTSGNLALGTGTTTPGARLDVRAQGALSTDIAFRVRNSANTADIFSVNGNGVFYKPHASSNNDVAQDVFVSQMSDGRNKIRLFTKGSSNVSSAIGISFQSDAAGSFISSYTLSGAFLNSGSSYQDNGGLSVFNVGTSNVAGYSFLRLKNNLGTQDNIYLSRTGTIILNPDNSNAQVRGLSIFGGILGASADRVISIGSGTAPTTSPADAFQQYSADITAGNAAPHFRTENGAIVKVYQETTGVGASTLVSAIGTPLTDTDTFDGYTLKQIVKALRNQGLLA